MNMGVFPKKKIDNSIHNIIFKRIEFNKNNMKAHRKYVLIYPHIGYNRYTLLGNFNYKNPATKHAMQAYCHNVISPLIIFPQKVSLNGWIINK